MPADSFDAKMTGYLERNALSFARSHDWGKDAFLMNGTIHNLLDERVHVATGIVFRERVTVPATLAAVRAFGNY